MTTTAPPTPDDEPQGPAAWAAHLYGRPIPTTETPTGPAEWHTKMFPKKETR